MPDDPQDGGAPAQDGGAPQDAGAPGGAPQDAGTQAQDGGTPATDPNADPNAPVDGSQENCATPHDPPDPSDPPSNPDCNYTGTTITYGTTTIDTSQTPVTQISVIAGHNNTLKAISLSLTGATGPNCPPHSTALSILPVPSTNGGDGVTSLTFSLPSSLSQAGVWNQDNLLLNVTPDVYNVTIATCGKSESIAINVYPDLQYSWTANCNFGSQQVNSNANGDPPALTGDGATVTFTETFDGSPSDSFGVDMLAWLKNGKAICDIVQQTSSFASAALGGTFTMSIIYPNISATNSWGYVENPDHTVSPNGTITFGANSLIGVSFEVSLLKAGVAALGINPQIFAIMDKIKEWSGGALIIKVDLVAGIKGTIGCTYTQTLGQAYSVSVADAITVYATLSASIGTQSCVCRVTASGSATASAGFTTTITLTQVVKPAGNLSVDFNGLDITLVVTGDVAVGIFKQNESGTLKYTPVPASNVGKSAFNLN